MLFLSNVFVEWPYLHYSYWFNFDKFNKICTTQAAINLFFLMNKCLMFNHSTVIWQQRTTPSVINVMKWAIIVQNKQKSFHDFKPASIWNYLTKKWTNWVPLIRCFWKTFGISYTDHVTNDCAPNDWSTHKALRGAADNSQKNGPYGPEILWTIIVSW